MHTGAAATASFGNNSSRLQLPGDFQGFSLQAPGVKSAFLADLFATLSFTAQHGNFQRLFLDLSRFHARLDFPSGSKLLSGATRLAQDFFNSQQPSMEALQAICPNTTLSFQQQVCEISITMFDVLIYFLNSLGCFLARVISRKGEFELCWE